MIDREKSAIIEQFAQPSRLLQTTSDCWAFFFLFLVGFFWVYFGVSCFGVFFFLGVFWVVFVWLVSLIFGCVFFSPAELVML